MVSEDREAVDISAAPAPPPLSDIAKEVMDHLCAADSVVGGELVLIGSKTDTRHTAVFHGP